jgi:hypothetical protein
MRRYLFLSAVFPEIQWKPWRFKGRAGNAVTEDPTAMKKVIRYVEENLNLTTREDWDKVTEVDLKDLKVAAYFEKHGGVKETLALFKKSD